MGPGNVNVPVDISYALGGESVDTSTSIEVGTADFSSVYLIGGYNGGPPVNSPFNQVLNLPANTTIGVGLSAKAEAGNGSVASADVDPYFAIDPTLRTIRDTPWSLVRALSTRKMLCPNLPA
jgi:hypothetical protein